MGKALKFSDNAIETTTVLAEIQCHDTRSRSRLSNYDVLGWYWNQSEETRKCLSNALDVLATIDPFSEQIFRGRDLYASFRVISNERTGTLWYKLHDSQHGYGISLCSQYICHHYVLLNPIPEESCFWDRRSYCTSDKSHRRYEDWRATGCPQMIDRILVTASLAVFVASQIISSVSRPGPFYALSWFSSIAFLLFVWSLHQYFDERRRRK
jgi:hypothetical protein